MVGSISLGIVFELLDFDEGMVDLGCSCELLAWSTLLLTIVGLLVLDVDGAVILLVEVHRWQALLGLLDQSLVLRLLLR